MTERDYLQVFMIHDSVIEGFNEWIDSNGWKLAQIPRSPDISEDDYVVTHIIVPKDEAWFVPSGGATASSSHGTSHATPSTSGDDRTSEDQPPGTE